MAQHIQSSWDGHIAVHRYEDLEVIQAAIESIKPSWAVELGTAEGGFAAFLATILGTWGGQVHSFDWKVDPGVVEQLAKKYLNLTIIEGNVLEANRGLDLLLRRNHGLLYTDNGNKQKELELWAPLLPAPAMVGTHDYGTEVSPEWAEGFMASIGFQPYRHEEFARLAHDVDYPVSLTRFWVKGDWSHARVHIVNRDTRAGMDQPNANAPISSSVTPGDFVQSDRTAEDQAQA